MLRLTLSRPTDLSALGGAWRDLEKRADPSPFQTWSWVGCLAAERFSDPVLLTAEEEGRTVGLALCNRRSIGLASSALHLGESGRPDLDAVFVEHNGPLVARDRPSVLGPCLEALLTLPLDGRRGGRALVLSGVDGAVLRAANALPHATCRIRRIMGAPWRDLAGLGADGLPEHTGSSTRYALRRSARRYAAYGAIDVRRAQTVAEAQGFLDALAVLHQNTWTARGRAGAFANPAFVRFHRAFLGHAVERQEADLLRISFGDKPIGYLYNLRSGKDVCAYQSGFDYQSADPHQKPGLTSHHLAIEAYRAKGFLRYDFLAGDDRYKKSLADRATDLYWLEIVPTYSLRWGWLAARDALAGKNRPPGCGNCAAITEMCESSGAQSAPA